MSHQSFPELNKKVVAVVSSQPEFQGVNPSQANMHPCSSTFDQPPLTKTQGFKVELVNGEFLGFVICIEGLSFN